MSEATTKRDAGYAFEGETPPTKLRWLWLESAFDQDTALGAHYRRTYTTYLRPWRDKINANWPALCCLSTRLQRSR